jgi:multidrug efflux pump subunit AcrB
VFLPIVFVEGIAGQLFRDQALTVTYSLLASLVVAVTMIPMLAAIGRDRAVDAAAGADQAAATAAPRMTLGWFSRGYDRFLKGALRLRWATLAIAFSLFFVSLASLR